MKRITVSLPDELVEQIKRSAGGEGRVSAYVATALAEHEERERLDNLLAEWEAEDAVPDDVRQQVRAELDAIGFAPQPRDDTRTAG